MMSVIALEHLWQDSPILSNMPPKKKQQNPITSPGTNPEGDQSNSSQIDEPITKSELQRILDDRLKIQTEEFKKLICTYHSSFLEELNKIQASTEIFKEEIDASQDFLNQKFEELTVSVIKIQTENTRLSHENSSLKTQLLELNNRLVQSENEQESTNQYLRRDCLEFHGIPEIPGEDTDALVCKVAELLEVDLYTSDISISHRLPAKKGQTPAIIARFYVRKTRDKLYQARANLKTYNSTNLGFERENKLYVNECLTSKSRNILKQAKEIQKQHKYKYVWTKYGKVYMRKDQHSDAISFANPSELLKFKERFNTE